MTYITLITLDLGGILPGVNSMKVCSQPAIMYNLLTLLPMLFFMSSSKRRHVRTNYPSRPSGFSL